MQIIPLGYPKICCLSPSLSYIPFILEQERQIDLMKTLAYLFVISLFITPCAHTEDGLKWYKGNLHTHSLWSDGDTFPELVVQWYKNHWYDFLAISDHNTLHSGKRWVMMDESKVEALKRYRAMFEEGWVEERSAESGVAIRLKTLDEYRGRFEEDGVFLLIQGEEITEKLGPKHVHLNVTNIRDFIPPQGGVSVFDIMQRNIDAVNVQRQRTGQPMFPHVNHPNYHYSVTSDEIARLNGEKFFEVYNGHPLVHNNGDSSHSSTEKMWDEILASRLEAGGEVIYGLAVDDAHDYFHQSPSRSNPGRGWVMVQSGQLTPGDLINSMEQGMFYSTTGVVVDDVRHDARQLSIQIRPEANVLYTTTFVGTRDSKGSTVGEVLQVERGTSAFYKFRGDELYIRATITSSKLKQNPQAQGEFEKAWLQPVIPHDHQRTSEGWQ